MDGLGGGFRKIPPPPKLLFIPWNMRYEARLLGEGVVIINLQRLAHKVGKHSLIEHVRYEGGQVGFINSSALFLLMFFFVFSFYFW